MPEPSTTEGRFAGEVAIVTGAGEGIGRAIAGELARAGAAVLLNDIDRSRAERAAEEIRAGGGTCEAAPGDVSQVGVVRGLVGRAAGRFGRVTLVAANAGNTLWSPFLETSPEAFERLLAVNLGGAFFLAQTLLVDGGFSVRPTVP